MFEWLAQHYLRLIANFRILLSNPTHCSTVELLQFFTLTLAALFVVKVVLHSLIFQILKRKCRRYSAVEAANLMRVYRVAAQKANVRRLPPIFAFWNVRPLVFTIGSLRPAIFLAPLLVQKLPDEELEAVLVHELTHIRRFDNLLLWLLEVFFLAIPLLIIQFFAVNFIFSVENSLWAVTGTLAALVLFRGVLWRWILFLRELSCDDLSVDVIRDPLVLAASLLSVWRCTRAVPRFRWHSALNFAQTLLPEWMNLEYRVRRLTEYRRPWLKFAAGRVVRYLMVGVVVFILVFLWRFDAATHQSRPFQLTGPPAQAALLGNGLPAPLQNFRAAGDSQWQNHCVTLVAQYTQCVNQNDAAGLAKILQADPGTHTNAEVVAQLHQIFRDYFGRIGSIENIRLPGPRQIEFTAKFVRGEFDVTMHLNGAGKVCAISYRPQSLSSCLPF